MKLDQLDTRRLMERRSPGTEPMTKKTCATPNTDNVADSAPLTVGAGDAPLALTIRETSALLRLDPRTIRAMVRTGELEGNKRGHAIRVRRASVVEWLRGARPLPRSTR